MSFKMIDHYVVQPKRQLRHKVAKFEAHTGQQGAGILLDRFLYSCVPERFEHPAAGLVKMKLFFLMEMHDEFFRSLNNPDASFVRSLLGEPPYTEQIFDLWWRVARVNNAGSIEVAVEGYRERNMGALVSSPHPMIETWLERFRKDD